MNILESPLGINVNNLNDITDVNRAAGDCGDSCNLNNTCPGNCMTQGTPNIIVQQREDPTLPTE